MRLWRRRKPTPPPGSVCIDCSRACDEYNRLGQVQHKACIARMLETVARESRAPDGYIQVSDGSLRTGR